LIEQVKLTLKIFKHTHLDCVAIFVFDQSSAYKGFAEDALNVNNMNIHHRGRQRKLCDTVIPLSNPPPAQATHGKEDTHSWVQKICFPDDHPEPELRGKPKGMRVILQEHKSVWDKYAQTCKECGVKEVGKYALYSNLQTCKDVECHIMLVEAVGQKDTASAEDMAIADSVTPPTSDNMWCWMQCVLSLQEDFQTERPLIQTLIEDSGHICLFLP